MSVRLYPSFDTQYHDDTELFFAICMAMSLTGEDTFDLSGYTKAVAAYRRAGCFGDYHESQNAYNVLAAVPAWNIVHSFVIYGFGRFVSPDSIAHLDVYAGHTESVYQTLDLIGANRLAFKALPVPLMSMISGFYWN